MLRRVSVLALALIIAACDRGTDDGGPSYADVRKAKIHILAGDGQVAPVATSPERAGDLAPRLQGGAEEAYDLFPDVLEVWVGAGMRLMGEPVAPGTDVHWIVRDEGCGRPVGQTTSTDADGRAVNRWIRGTRARECRMDVCRILSDGALACDTTFVAVQEASDPVVNPYTFRATARQKEYVPGVGFTGELFEFSGLYDQYGNLTKKFRVEAVGSWLEHAGGEFGSPESRSVRLIGAPSIGDTATVRFYNAFGDLLIDAIAELREAVWDDGQGNSGTMLYISARARHH